MNIVSDKEQKEGHDRGYQFLTQTLTMENGELKNEQELRRILILSIVCRGRLKSRGQEAISPMSKIKSSYLLGKWEMMSPDLESKKKFRISCRRTFKGKQ